MADKEFDLVIFGATGMAGKYCIEQMAKSSDGLKWAVAGRDETRMKACLQEVQGWLSSDSFFDGTTPPSILSTPFIYADITKPDSLKKMTAKTKCVVNTVGPYTTWGEPMIVACLATGTHMLDLSGELHYNESMRNKYHKIAREKGVYFIATAGFDSIPCESLLQFAREHVCGRLNSLETFVTFDQGKFGSAINTGTWNSMINIFQNLSLMTEVRKEAWGTAFDKPWQPMQHQKNRSMMINCRSSIPGYTVPFLGGDKPCVTHSEFFRAEVTEGYKRTQIQTYLYQNYLIAVFAMILMSTWMLILSQFSLGRKLLSSYPGFFSFGMFKKGGPTREQALTCGFTMWGIGLGWFEGEDEQQPPTRRVVVKMEGPEVAYVATSVCIITAATCLLKESDKIPIKGGYLTPGFALEKTSLYKRLMRSGFDYSLVSAAE